jgi:hypothetical protein
MIQWLYSCTLFFVAQRAASKQVSRTCARSYNVWHTVAEVEARGGAQGVVVVGPNRSAREKCATSFRSKLAALVEARKL